MEYSKLVCSGNSSDKIHPVNYRFSLVQWLAQSKHATLTDDSEREHMR